MRAHDVDAISEVLAGTPAYGVALERGRAEPASLLVRVGRGELWLSCCDAPLEPDPSMLVDLCICASPAGLDQGAAYLPVDVPTGAGLSLLQSADVCLAAVLLAETVSMGAVALVRSHDGLERSALVAGLALRLLGCDGLEAVQLVRGRRRGALRASTYATAVALPLEGAGSTLPGPSASCAARGLRRGRVGGGPGRRVAGAAARRRVGA